MASETNKKESRIEEVARDILFELWWRYWKYRSLFACRLIIREHLRAHQLSQPIRFSLAVAQRLVQLSRETKKPMYRLMARKINPEKAIKAFEHLDHRSQL